MQWNLFSHSPASWAWQLGPTSTENTTAHRPASGSAGDVAVVIYDIDADVDVASASTHPAPFESHSSDSRSGRVCLQLANTQLAHFFSIWRMPGEEVWDWHVSAGFLSECLQREILASNPPSRGGLMVSTTTSSKRPFSACQTRHQFSEHSMPECQRTKPLGPM